MFSKPSKSDNTAIFAPYSIGSKLRTLRTERGLTLARLGAETGYSSALLSKLESDRMLPTLQTLARISRVYGVELCYFFSGVTHHSLAITRSAHFTNDRREQFTAKQIPLHRSTGKSKQVSKVVDIPPGVTLNIGESGARTELTAYVLEGTLRMTAAGVDDILHTGDCVVLDTDATVLWTATDSRCRVLAVVAK